MQANIIKKRGNPNVAISQVTPFANRRWCFNDITDKILSNTKPLETHYIWLDNGDLLPEILKKTENFPNITIIKDDSDSFDINPFVGKSEFPAALETLAKKIYYTYQFCFSQLGDSHYTWVVEDDVEVPTNALKTLKQTLVNQTSIGTVAGRLIDRRPHEYGQSKTVVQNYKILQTLGTFTSYEVTAKQLDLNLTNSVPPRFGVQLVGSTHMGCWLTRTDLIKKVGIAVIDDGCLCIDNNWGWRIYKYNGSRVAVDWSVDCKHHYRVGSDYRVAE